MKEEENNKSSSDGHVEMAEEAMVLWAVRDLDVHSPERVALNTRLNYAEADYLMQDLAERGLLEARPTDD